MTKHHPPKKKVYRFLRNKSVHPNVCPQRVSVSTAASWIGRPMPSTATKRPKIGCQSVGMSARLYYTCMGRTFGFVCSCGGRLNLAPGECAILPWNNVAVETAHNKFQPKHMANDTQQQKQVNNIGTDLVCALQTSWTHPALGLSQLPFCPVLACCIHDGKGNSCKRICYLPENVLPANLADTDATFD